MYQTLLKSYDLTMYTDTDGFRPYSELTREEAAKMLTNYARNVLCRQPVTTYTGFAGYTDIADADPTLVPYIQLAYEYGIMKGAGTSFRPHDIMTYQELVTAMTRMVINKYLPESDNDQWYLPYFTAAQSFGVAIPDTQTRYDASKMLYTLYGNKNFTGSTAGYFIPYNQ